ncbi:hypothetical protein BJY00DRAFT_318663 [Aspergillus carlsbadensis]|nr:hypothetical protein BJY00DRAFT_318663 [Aspergillus carlsbadensis]
MSPSTSPETISSATSIITMNSEHTQLKEIPEIPYLRYYEDDATICFLPPSLQTSRLCTLPKHVGISIFELANAVSAICLALSCKYILAIAKNVPIDFSMPHTTRFRLLQLIIPKSPDAMLA